MWLYLFDVDGTLVHSGGAGRLALEGAFQRVLGLAGGDPVSQGIRFDGRTDRLIMEDIARAVGLSEREFASREKELLRAYLEFLPEAVARSERKRLIYPGVRELLEALAARPNLELGLLTGNLEEGARVKLAPFDLNRFFPAGGFGSDSSDRREIARVARIRYQEFLGMEIPPARVVVVGDTPADVDCARAAGYHVVAVATGNTPRETVEAAGPDLFFPDLSDTPAVLESLFTLFPPD